MWAKAALATRDLPRLQKRSKTKIGHHDTQKNAKDHAGRILSIANRVPQKGDGEEQEYAADGLIPENAGRPRHFGNDVLSESLCVVDVCVAIHNSKRVCKLYHALMLAPESNQARQV
jgi:hypothetical protein